MSLFVLGFLFGMSHALEADHLLSISSMVNRKMTVKRLTSLGVFWGLGHTFILLLVTAGVVFFNLIMSDRWSHILEFSVGIMLVILGLDVLRKVKKNQIHFHVHRHQDGEIHLHAHLHSHLHTHTHNHNHKGVFHPVPHHDHEHRPLPWKAKLKPFLVGLIHGGAGSSALLTLAMVVSEDNVTKLLYVLFFAMGSLIGMAAVTLSISWPIKKISGINDQRFTRYYRMLNYSLSFATILLGIVIMARNKDIFF